MKRKRLTTKKERFFLINLIQKYNYEKKLYNRHFHAEINQLRQKLI